MKILKIKFFFSMFLISLLTFSCDDENTLKVDKPSAFELKEMSGNATAVELQPTFAWNASKDPNGNSLSYDLYLDTKNPPVSKIASNLLETSHTLDKPLENKTKYYWKVTAINENGAKTESIVSEFTTTESISEPLLIGKWFFEAISDENTACELTSYLEFYEDGTAFGILFTDDDKGNCVPLLATSYNLEFLSKTKIKFILLDDKGNEIKDDFFISEIISINETKMVLKDFAFFIDRNMSFKKASE